MKLIKSTIMLIATIFAVSAFAAPPINTLTNSSLFARETGIAILGYDTVSYFTEGKPVKGKDEFATEWMGAKWKFSSQKNLDMFKAEPTKYAPQYGGYCAYGVANDSLVKIEANQFSIIDGKLYLNYDADVQKDFSKDPQGYISKANKKFADLLKK